MARISRFCAAFPAGDAAMIQEMLGDYLWESISVRDTAVRRNMKENFYHGMLLGLLRSQDSWLVKSNAETGEGVQRYFHSDAGANRDCDRTEVRGGWEPGRCLQ